ncbi:unnamed protein product [Adineta steineri]|uniref:Uncharacterized protein n=1 Tax=Adineta steineri TaxID=433720 RepID=A0A815Q2Q5_9BILA|nr:unnamed protein product [Adineta steineri]CAF1632366.1 unnamed protein product [Adineta steineri]
MSQLLINMIWLDQTNDHVILKTERIATHLSLCKIDPYLNIFRNIDSCIDHINNISQYENTIFLFISTQISSSSINSLLQVCEELVKIDSIYILCDSFEMNVDFFEISTKICFISTGVELMLEELDQLQCPRQRRRGEFKRLDFIINSMPSQANSIILGDDASSAAQLDLTMESDSTNRQESEFLYGEFIREILVELPSSAEEMLEFCRQKYINSEANLQTIEEFDEYYEARNAIFWYTRDTFLYRLLNQALREQDIDTLYALRYFIKDLHLQLETVHESHHSGTNNSSTESTRHTVYRGQLMAVDEFNKKIRDNVGGFFSVRSLFSTTQQREKSLRYAGDGSRLQSDNEYSVVFQITMDEKINKYAYADVSSVSAFDDEESEVLFAMGAVFRIISIVEENIGFWVVELTLTDDEDKELRAISEYMRDELLEPLPLQRLAQLLYEMANYDKAEKYYLLLLHDPEVVENLKLTSIVLNDLGLIYHETEQVEQAVVYYNKSLQLKLENLPETDPSFSVVYNNLGEIYREQNEYEKALFHYEKAIYYYRKAVASELNALCLPSENLLSTYYNNIALVYNTQQNYPEALKMFQKSLEVDLKSLPQHHPLLSITFNNISQTYYGMGDYEKAVEYLHKTLEIKHRSLPPNHPTIGDAYRNLGKAVYAQGKWEEALNYMKKAYDINSKTFSSNSSKVIETLEWITRIEKEIHIVKNKKNDRENV